MLSENKSTYYQFTYESTPDIPIGDTVAISSNFTQLLKPKMSGYFVIQYLGAAPPTTNLIVNSNTPYYDTNNTVVFLLTPMNIKYSYIVGNLIRASYEFNIPLPINFTRFTIPYLQLTFLNNTGTNLTSGQLWGGLIT